MWPFTCSSQVRYKLHARTTKLIKMEWKACVCVSVNSQLHNYTECVINAICFRKEKTGISPTSCALHLTLMTPNTNLNFSKAPENQLVLEMLWPLCPPFDSLKICIDQSDVQGPSHICCSLSFGLWDLDSAHFVFLHLKLH